MRRRRNRVKLRRKLKGKPSVEEAASHHEDEQEEPAATDANFGVEVVRNHFSNSRTAAQASLFSSAERGKERSIQKSVQV